MNMNNEFLKMQKLAGLITEGEYKEKLTEEASNDVEEYLKHNFKVYLEGGDTFEEEPGETHTFTMEQDEFGNPEYYDDADMFEKSIEQLSNSPIVLDDEMYGDVNFKRNGNDILVSFVVPNIDEEY